MFRAKKVRDHQFPSSKILQDRNTQFVLPHLLFSLRMTERKSKTLVVEEGEKKLPRRFHGNYNPGYLGNIKHDILPLILVSFSFQKENQNKSRFCKQNASSSKKTSQRLCSLLDNVLY